MSAGPRASSSGTGQRALAGLLVLGSCTLAGSWLSLAWPEHEAHAARLAAEQPMRTPAAPAPEPQVLAEFETRARPPAAREQRAPQLAAARIHGLVLAPGERFDFAARVLDGLAVPCPPGCLDQLASTLHAAALFAGLPIVERAPQARPNFYIKLGLEAAVGADANLRFENDRSFPVSLDVQVAAGTIRARVRGAARELKVKWIRDVHPSAPVPERSELDPSLPRGMRVLAQRGSPGFEVQVQRVIRDEAGQRSIHELSQHSYPATEQLWRIGIAGAPRPGFVRPQNDPHPEFIADAHVEMTQTAPGSFEVQRDAGRTGSYGWTARTGMLRAVRRE